jgi:hypothetical protein
MSIGNTGDISVFAVRGRLRLSENCGIRCEIYSLTEFSTAFVFNGIVP